ncbi:MAG: serine/threonine protein kinase [Lachnospiraceae bacterium]|nr:serine/threonine protein kinase [Lachnospiraceae bacterium]
MAAIGTVIEDKYEILKLIGRGGMSEVYLAMDKNLNKQWAVKEIKRIAHDENNQVVVQSALVEANLMKKLDHPCLPRIVDIIEREDVIFVVMDYVEGESLNKVLEKEGAIAQEYVIEWAQDLCSVLDYLHMQNPPIIYRDMKPGNIMLQPNGNIKLIDFGIAREYKEQNLEDTMSLGTKGYAAPEQFGGKGQTDARTDIYCLGTTMYHLVTGKSPTEPPYEIVPIRQWNENLSAGLENIILKCTKPNPDDRYQNCGELIYALDHYEEEDDEYRSKQWRKVNAFALMVVFSLVFACLGVICKATGFFVNQNDYNHIMQQAQVASRAEDKAIAYAEAIDVNPTSYEAYYGMIDAFKDDAVFSLEEEAMLNQRLNENLNELRKDENYPQLAFELGKLYWFYYDYGKTESSDNQITRMKSAIQWFDDAKEYGNESDDNYMTAYIYSEIGTFHRDITLNVEEASDQGLYGDYFANLQKLVDMTAGENSEIVQLEVYKLCMYSIENYARKFKADGIEQSELTDFYNLVKDSVGRTEVTTEKTELLKNEVMNRSTYAKQAIENAFMARIQEESKEDGE